MPLSHVKWGTDSEIDHAPSLACVAWVLRSAVGAQTAVLSFGGGVAAHMQVDT